MASAYTRTAKETDPLGPTTAGASRVIRGGSFYSGPRDCRAASRSVMMPSFRSGISFRQTYRDDRTSSYPSDIGFRVAVSR